MLQLKGESCWTGYTPYLGGLAQTLGSERYSVNICCLNSGWGSFSKSKPHSSLGTMQAWFPTGEPVRGRGSCPLNLAPHWLFQVGAGPHFPLMEQFPIDVLKEILKIFKRWGWEMIGYSAHRWHRRSQQKGPSLKNQRRKVYTFKQICG